MEEVKQKWRREGKRIIIMMKSEKNNIKRIQEICG